MRRLTGEVNVIMLIGGVLFILFGSFFPGMHTDRITSWRSNQINDAYIKVGIAMVYAFFVHKWFVNRDYPSMSAKPSFFRPRSAQDNSRVPNFLVAAVQPRQAVWLVFGLWFIGGLLVAEAFQMAIRPVVSSDWLFWLMGGIFTIGLGFWAKSQYE